MDRDYVPFSKFLEWLGERGWELMKSWGTYRIFMKPRSSELPILIEVFAGRVLRSDVERIARRVFGEDLADFDTEDEQEDSHGDEGNGAS